MAQADQEQVMALLETVRTDSQAVAALLERVAGQEAWQAIEGSREIVDPPAAINKADELRAKWGTEGGQLWQIGAHRILCADCRDQAAVGRQRASSAHDMDRPALRRRLRRQKRLPEPLRPRLKGPEADQKMTP